VTRSTAVAVAVLLLAVVAAVGLVVKPWSSDPAAQSPCDKPVAQRVGGWACPDG
jgi:hypothetical protein